MGNPEGFHLYSKYMVHRIDAISMVHSWWCWVKCNISLFVGTFVGDIVGVYDVDGVGLFVGAFLGDNTFIASSSSTHLYQ